MCHARVLVGDAQVFVANPNKTEPIVELLSGNKEKLLKYLSDFHTDKGTIITAFTLSRVRGL